MTDLRYVILRHQNILEPHFDLLFETTPGALLSAFRSDLWPINQPILLVKLADHRRIYLDYEGPISGGRGEVKQVESGHCQITRHSPTHWEIILLNDHPAKLILQANNDGTWRCRKG